MNRKIPYPQIRKAEYLIITFNRLRHDPPPRITRYVVAEMVHDEEDLDATFDIADCLGLVDDDDQFSDSAILLLPKEKLLGPHAPRSPIIKSIRVEGAPVEPFRSIGDLSLNTRADNGEPIWNESQFEASPIPGVTPLNQGSAMFHPEVRIFDSPTPWGPWTYAGTWLSDDAPEHWKGGYMPGIISKGTEPDSFWFTISGQNLKPKITYSLNLGKIVMELRRGSEERI